MSIGRGDFSRDGREMLSQITQFKSTDTVEVEKTRRGISEHAGRVYTLLDSGKVDTEEFQKALMQLGNDFRTFTHDSHSELSSLEKMKFKYSFMDLTDSINEAIMNKFETGEAALASPLENCKAIKLVGGAMLGVVDKIDQGMKGTVAVAVNIVGGTARAVEGTAKWVGGAAKWLGGFAGGCGAEAAKVSECTEGVIESTQQKKPTVEVSPNKLVVEAAKWQNTPRG